MNIASAKVMVTCPGRNFVTSKIATDAGVYCFGDAPLSDRELAVASSLIDHNHHLLHDGYHLRHERTGGRRCDQGLEGPAIQ